MRCGIRRGFSYQNVSRAVSIRQQVTVGKSNIFHSSVLFAVLQCFTNQRTLARELILQQKQ